MHVCSHKLGVSVRLSEFMFSGGCSDNVISLIWILIVGKDISGFRIRILSQFFLTSGSQTRRKEFSNSQLVKSESFSPGNPDLSFMIIQEKKNNSSGNPSLFQPGLDLNENLTVLPFLQPNIPIIEYISGELPAIIGQF